MFVSKYLATYKIQVQENKNKNNYSIIFYGDKVIIFYNKL